MSKHIISQSINEGNRQKKRRPMFRTPSAKPLPPPKATCPRTAGTLILLRSSRRNHSASSAPGRAFDDVRSGRNTYRPHKPFPCTLGKAA